MLAPARARAGGVFPLSLLVVAPDGYDTATKHSTIEQVSQGFFCDISKKVYPTRTTVSS